VLAGHLSGRGGPPAVPAQHLHGVARTDVMGDGVFEADVLHVGP
jgi:hypothetical protein